MLHHCKACISPEWQEWQHVEIVLEIGMGKPGLLYLWWYQWHCPPQVVPFNLNKPLETQQTGRGNRFRVAWIESVPPSTQFSSFPGIQSSTQDLFFSLSPCPNYSAAFYFKAAHLLWMGVPAGMRVNIMINHLLAQKQLQSVTRKLCLSLHPFLILQLEQWV